MITAYPIAGGCECGAIKYQITSAPLFASVCACSACKKQSGSAFGISLRVRREHLRVVSGQPKTWSRPADSGANIECAFCENCGNRIWNGSSAIPDCVSIKPGTLEEPNWFQPRYLSSASNLPTWLTLTGIERAWDGHAPMAAQQTEIR